MPAPPDVRPPGGYRRGKAAISSTPQAWISSGAAGYRFLDSNPFSLPNHWETICLGISGERYPDLRSGRYRRFAPTISACGRRYPANGRTWGGYRRGKAAISSTPQAWISSMPAGHGYRSLNGKTFSLPYHWEIIYPGISGERYPDLRSGRYRRFAPTISACGRRYPANGRTWGRKAYAANGKAPAP